MFKVELLRNTPREPRFTWLMHYASVENVIRYGLRRDGMPAGQYDIKAPDGATTRAYRRA